MPECAIGLYPDIGASFFLNQLPGRLGMYLALTGARLQGSTLLEAGLATHYLPSACVHTLPARLAASLAAKPGSHRRELGTVAGVLSAAQAEAGTPPPGQLSRLLPLLDQHFVYDTVPEIMVSLESAASKASGENTFADAFVRDALEAMKRGSPLSQAITLKLMRRAAHAPLRTCLAVDTLLVSKFVRGDGDFIQGVRSVLIDRGTKPAWKYATSEQVPSAAVEHFFADTPFASVQACSLPQATSKL
ncbi:uncharacterized protein HaLaN_28869 [Haematococcus lacustris]|uniref:3-hydroxyisobutyryl-CoA hydrolase n=1 Tax=Haematococcus lacustris TaxID=44745 RepID=A0A6A0ABJ1_HAELA|nr:uncharacterized protein HaLaN_28869 [Haematococcus lacustris]